MSCQLHRLGRRAQDTEPWCSKTQGPQPQDTNLGAHQPEGPRVPTQLLGLPKGENSLTTITTVHFIYFRKPLPLDFILKVH